MSEVGFFSTVRPGSTLLTIERPSGPPLLVPAVECANSGMPLIPAEAVYSDLLQCRALNESHLPVLMSMAKVTTNKKHHNAWATMIRRSVAYPVGHVPREQPVLSFGQAIRALTRFYIVADAGQCAVKTWEDVNPLVVGLATAIDLHADAIGRSEQCALRSPRRALLRARENSTAAAAAAAAASVAAASESATWKVWTSFKRHNLHSLEYSLPELLPWVWRPGTRVLDIGAGGGEIDGYLEAKYGVNIAAYDVSPPEANRWTMAKASAEHRTGWATPLAKPGTAQGLPAAGFQPHPISVFDGASLPAEQDRSHDWVLFNAVLHHAARNAPLLIAEAARIAQSAIVLIEDVHPEQENNPSSGLIQRRNHEHEARWRALLMSAGHSSCYVLGSVRLASRRAHFLAGRWHLPLAARVDRAAAEWDGLYCHGRAPSLPEGVHLQVRDRLQTHLSTRPHNEGYLGSPFDPAATNLHLFRRPAPGRKWIADHRNPGDVPHKYELTGVTFQRMFVARRCAETASASAAGRESSGRRRRSHLSTRPSTLINGR
jgi:SAM-dependent methyltransferase